MQVHGYKKLLQRQCLLSEKQQCYVVSSKNQHDVLNLTHTKCHPDDLSAKSYMVTNCSPVKGYTNATDDDIAESKLHHDRNLVDDPPTKCHRLDNCHKEASDCHPDLDSCTDAYSGKCYDAGGSKWHLVGHAAGDGGSTGGVVVYSTSYSQPSSCSSPPSRHMWAEPYTPPSPYSPPLSYGSPPHAPFPLVMGHADEHGGKEEVMLEGRKVACFRVGGEQRLCFPQVLNTSLSALSTREIKSECQALHIYLSLCSKRQLQMLKDSAVLPSTVWTCGLITYSDAHRLTHALLHANSPPADPPRSITVPYNSLSRQFLNTKQHLQQQQLASVQHSSNTLIPNMIVSHRCFGKCRGWVYLRLYEHPDSKCVQCCECKSVYTPQQFVCHAHRSLETRTCHWGFDPANWRLYLQLASDQPLPPHGAAPQPLPETALEIFKTKFDPVAIAQAAIKLKQVR